MRFLPLSTDEDQLKGCHFKDTAEVYVALEIVLQEFMYGCLQKCFKQLYKRQQNSVVTKDSILNATES
jgi:hypothetical protein